MAAYDYWVPVDIGKDEAGKLRIDREDGGSPHTAIDLPDCCRRVSREHGVWAFGCPSCGAMWMATAEDG